MKILSRIADLKASSAIMILVLALGAAVRLCGLDIQSLWTDEFASLRCIESPSFSDTIRNVVCYDGHPPGYHFILSLLLGSLDNSEFTLRLPSALSGVLAIFCIFMLGRHIFSEEEGLIAAALMAVLACPIYYSQDARPYSMLLLFVLLSAYFWITALERLAQQRRFIAHGLAYAASAIVASYMHYYGALLVLLQGVGALLYCLIKKVGLLRVLGLYSVVFVSYLPWINFVLRQIDRDPAFWIQKPELAFLYHYIEFLYNNSRRLLWIVLPMYLFLFLKTGVVFLRKRVRRNSKMPFLCTETVLLLWFFVPYVIAHAVSVFVTPVLIFRYLIVSLPAAYLLLARAFTQLPLSHRKRILVVFLVMGVFLFHLFSVREYYSRPTKPQFREAAGYIAARLPAYERSLVVGWAWYPYDLNYYLAKAGVSREIDLMAGQENDIGTVRNVIRDRNAKHLWYFWAHRRPSAEFSAFLHANFNTLSHEAFQEAEVWLLKPKGEGF